MNRISTRGNLAFSLLELLFVISIIALLMIATVPAISSVQSSYQLTKASSLLRDHLLLARQFAISRNTSVVASICETEDASGSRSFNLLTLSRLDESGALHPLAKPVRLPEGFGIATGGDWSTLTTLPAASITVSSETLPCHQIRFKPSGTTDLPSSTNAILTVFKSAESTEPKVNFVTLVMDSVTGRVFSYQP